MTDTRCTVVVNSCDRYADLWQAFFTLLNRHWKDCPWRIVLNTESLPAPKGITAVHSAAGLCWTRRLQGVLKQLDTPYVVTLLDDFFLTADTDTAVILDSLSEMEKHPEISCFSFYPTTGNPDVNEIPSELRLPGWDLRPQSGLYRFNAQAGLWRRECLISFLDADEDAWQWENEGNVRSFSVPDLFYSRRSDASAVFCYDFMKHGLIGGKWFPDTVSLFAEEKIEMDFSARGFYDPAKWALLPSVKSSFALDSCLYVDCGKGFDERLCMPFSPVVKEGLFCQVFTIPKGARQIRWDPSTHKGFGLENLQIFADALPLQPYDGNCNTLSDCCFFLQDDPQLIFVLPVGAKKVTITGNILCPLTEEVLNDVLNTPIMDRSAFSPSLSERLRYRLQRLLKGN